MGKTFYVLLSAMEANEYVDTIGNKKSLFMLIKRIKPYQNQPLFYPNLNFPENSNILMKLFIFSGSQYFRNEEELKDYLQFTGIHVKPYSEIEEELAKKGLISDNGFISDLNREYVKKEWPQYKPPVFSENPKALIAQICLIRNHGETPDNAHYLEIFIHLRKPVFLAK